MRSSKSVIQYLGLVLLGALALLPAAALAQPAPDANSMLVLTSVDGGGSYSASATTQGFTVVPASDAEWAARTAGDFATFKAIILGDPSCGGTPPAVAEANAAVWGSVIDGPILIVGTDERFHFGQGGSQLIDSGIGFVGSGTAGQTGAYISMSCYYDGTPVSTPVPLLAPFGGFFAGPTGSCFNDAHIVAVHPALTGSTDVTLSNWGCSVHNVWNAFPSATFLPLAIAEGITGPGNLTFADGTNGIPYILASGGGITPIGCGNGVINPPEECDDGNTLSGDGCSSFCTIEGGGGPTAVVPTLSPWMMALLAVALAGAGLFVMTRFHS
ncbi:MAG: myxococcus cysteine-rich repeat containing protein [Thermoanaerobaculia bacterium]